MKTFSNACRRNIFFQNLTHTPFALARRLFTIKVEDVLEISQEEFIELIKNDVDTTDFSSMSISKFWTKCLKSYSVISEPFLRLLLPFPPTYLCETRFSSLSLIKSENVIKLDAEYDVR
ncbi:SCAN domain-containing protein 3 [Thelohanellus kitauei]|uniref:SCAN domain-containing protein 3 n=1 Tax=Thelohanellus kitauei TaxID=669202 RepID=A0A0C2IZJ8_THEKT|nr:SCAN domain-containing protein 3 [Thelohanellus kitauei]